MYSQQGSEEYLNGITTAMQMRNQGDEATVMEPQYVVRLRLLVTTVRKNLLYLKSDFPSIKLVCIQSVLCKGVQILVYIIYNFI